MFVVQNRPDNLETRIRDADDTAELHELLNRMQRKKRTSIS